MANDPVSDEHTWRYLWSRAAYDIISALPSAECYERIQVGAGWGLRRRMHGQQALLLHPSGTSREAGDLALTILGQGTHVVPRCSYSYPEYLDAVADAVKAAACAYLAIPQADTF